MSDEKKNDDMATIVGGGLTVDALKKAAAEKQAASKPVDDMATIVGGGLTVDALKKAIAEKQAASKPVDDMATMVGGGLTVDALKKAVAEKQSTGSLDTSNKAIEIPVKEEKPQTPSWEDPSNTFIQPQTASTPKEEEPKKGFLARIMSWLFG